MIIDSVPQSQQDSPRSTRLPNGGRGPNTVRPECHDFVIERMETFVNTQRAIPTRVVLLRPDPTQPSTDQLFIDQVPVARDTWSYDPRDMTLTWKGAFGGGHLRLSHDRLGAYGNIGPADEHVSVRASARAQFSCDVALNCGASYETSGGARTGMVWDPASVAWKSAEWVANRLLLTYTVTPGGPMEPPKFDFCFEDKKAESAPWEPVLGTFAADLHLGQKSGHMVWLLTFKSSVPPGPAATSAASIVPRMVYPRWLQAVEDSAATKINGVMEIAGEAPSGTLVGLQGVRVNPMISGYYKTAPNAAPFGVFDGRLVVGGVPAPRTEVVGDWLQWTGLSREYQQRTGLPANGRLQFTSDGSHALDNDAAVRVRRVGTTSALSAIAQHSDLHPEVHQKAGQFAAGLDATLDIYGLLAMTPFVNQQGLWSDVVQAAVTDDLAKIMNSSIPKDLWSLLFKGIEQPELSGELAKVASSPVAGVAQPSEWYRSLATAVLTSGMAAGSDPNCRYLNGRRAAAWLRTAVAESKVYTAHGAQLFTRHWQLRWPTTSDYLADQAARAASYQESINAAVSAAVADIKANVVVDPSSPPDLKNNLIDDVTGAGRYAIDNGLYWAFCYYQYNVAPATLAGIAMAMSVNTGSSDGTTLARLLQQNVSVLTALDPSGFFAQRYTATINTFMATNILPSMFGFQGDAMSFDLIKEYLQTFVNNNLHNADQQISEAANKIKQILDDEAADEILHDSIDALRTFSGATQDALALPYVANKWLTWFSGKYPKFSSAGNLFGSMLISGIAGLGVFNLLSDFKRFDELTAKEKASLILSTVQLGLQIVSAVVKRGVRIYALFSVNGMTALQRGAAVSKVVLTGDAAELGAGLLRIGNTMARWLGDTTGIASRLAAQEAGARAAVMAAQREGTVAEVSWAVKVFGKNMDEFVATRVAVPLVLLGISLSIWSIAEGESGVGLASDILNIVGGSLAVVAIVGTWAIAGGYIAAEGFLATAISFAGPLAILCALAGVGLMLYQMFAKKPDPVEQFVNEYALPAGFAVKDRASSIDYAGAYINKDRADLLMVGFTLSADGKTLRTNAQRAVTLDAATALPDCVWQASTDGWGMSRIFTVTGPADSPVLSYLSAMSDNTVSFQPAVSASARSEAGETQPTVVSQIWQAEPVGKATTTGDGQLSTIDMTFAAMKPPPEGTWPPSKVHAYLFQKDTTSVSMDGNRKTTFRLTMSGMAPNYMRMASPDIRFPLNTTPSKQQAWRPIFGVRPSDPMTFTLSGDALPGFLTFTPETGSISPNGQMAKPATSTHTTISAKNVLGIGQATFSINVTDQGVK